MSGFVEDFIHFYDLGYIATAFLICVVTVGILQLVLGRAASFVGSEQVTWLIGAACVAGIGFWTTHFVAMLGIRPDFVLGWSPGPTLASVIAGIVFAGGPIAASVLVNGLGRKAVCGAFGGLGVGVMHFIGMAALEGCEISNDWRIIMLALVAGAGFMAAGVASSRDTVFLQACGGVLMVLAVCALHFTALEGATLTPSANEVLWGFDTAWMSAVVTLGTATLCFGAYVLAKTSSRIEKVNRSSALAAEEQAQLLEMALENMSNGILMFDANWRIQFFGGRLFELLSLEPEDVQIDMSMPDYLRNVARRNNWNKERYQRTLEQVKVCFDTNESMKFERQYDTGRVLSIACNPLVRGGGIITYNDVTEERQIHAEMTHLAYHDVLTGLSNRRAFQENLQEAFGERNDISLLMIDLDRFKSINDTLGHAVGDGLLAQVAERLREQCRPADRIYRLGGDEFAIWPADLSGKLLRGFAERVCQALVVNFDVEGNRIRASCSIGVAQCADDGSDTVTTLTQKADLALYSAKKLGRGRVENYEEGMMEETAERRALEIDMEQAIRRGEFRLQYQPICALPDLSLRGFEALIRWEHPVRGLLSPFHFIPLAEENGMISAIGAWVLDEACRQAATWPEHLHVAINVSALEMRDMTLVSRVADALAKHDLDPGRVEIELTESAMVDNRLTMAECLRSLRELGVRISMDDFGTGYSSLAHLRDFELDVIKIDRSFIDRPADDIGSSSVVRAVAGMGRDMSVETVAEGIETREQLDRVISMGCSNAQGYFLGKPMDASKAREMIDSEPVRPERPQVLYHLGQR